MKLRIEQIVINYSGTSNANEENNSQYAEKYIFSFLIHIEYSLFIKLCQS